MRVFLFLVYSLLTFTSVLLTAHGEPNETTYMKPEEYIRDALGNMPEKPGILWITKDIRPDVEKILSRSTFPLRYRYWQDGSRTVWILEEIGKVLPITTGITIEDNRILDLSVLTYRESHGAEIRFPAFRTQFTDISLRNDLRLSKPINGITGATLSTNAMKKISRLALYLHSKIQVKDVPQAK